jgi:hypothetical protein
MMRRTGVTESKIVCPIGLFEPQEIKIEALTRSINAAPTAQEKAPLAQELIEEASVLSTCRVYDGGNANCVLCRNFSELRMKMANLILKAATSGLAP